MKWVKLRVPDALHLRARFVAFQAGVPVAWLYAALAAKYLDGVPEPELIDWAKSTYQPMSDRSLPGVEIDRSYGGS